jgi:adenylate kinase family enzyme
MEARKILVYGVTGSGKTTFARRLSEKTGIPWTSVDDLAWLPGWVSTGDEYQIGRAELVIGLDYPRWFSLLRLVRRTLARVIDKQPVCNGNFENWRLMLSRESILLWHFKSFSRKRARMRKWSQDPDRAVILFRNHREAESWLKQLGG